MRLVYRTGFYLFCSIGFFCSALGDYFDKQGLACQRKIPLRRYYRPLYRYRPNERR